MIFDAIVYSGRYVYEETYSAELHEKTGIPYYSFSQAKSDVRDNANIIYVGAVFKRNRIENYKKVAKKYNASIVCVIYIYETVNDYYHIDSIIKKNHIDKETHIIFLQNYIDKQSFINCNMTGIMTDWFIKNCVPSGL